MSNSPTAYIIRHLLFEDAGTLAALLDHRGYDLHILEPGVDDLALPDATDADLLIILGGPIGVHDALAYPFLTEEIDLIRRWIAGERPVLGICLGAQLIATALGATVYSTGRKEIGFSALDLSPAGEVSVLSSLAEIPVLHWHGDEFAIPEGGELLASTPEGPHQAFALGGQHGDRVLALQCHPEVNYRFIERWLIGHAGELAEAGIDPQVLRADAKRYGPALIDASRRVFTTWLDHISAPAATATDPRSH